MSSDSGRIPTTIATMEHAVHGRAASSENTCKAYDLKQRRRSFLLGGEKHGMMGRVGGKKS